MNLSFFFLTPLWPVALVRGMSARTLIEYLARCQARNTLSEAETATHVPPTAVEVKTLLAYLRKAGITATIVGSVGVLHHLKNSAEEFRPTVDLDLFVPITQEVLRRVSPPKGWNVDRASVGVVSWISPGGGYVDFLTAGHEFPGGTRTPRTIASDPGSDPDYPVATPVELFRLKLNSMRTKDISDLVSLARAQGRVPTDQEMGKLNDTQRENLDLVRTWFKLRP